MDVHFGVVFSFCYSSVYFISCSVSVNLQCTSFRVQVSVNLQCTSFRVQVSVNLQCTSFRVDACIFFPSAIITSL